ncbi:MAG: hypothetical protein JWN74_483 [Acidobacteriaceae bacterium]|nr:hypothetical protein [Acidobacteriaceae bacterium]
MQDSRKSPQTLRHLYALSGASVAAGLAPTIGSGLQPSWRRIRDNPEMV